MDVPQSLGEELDKTAENDFGSFIQLGEVLLELAGNQKGQLDVTQPVNPDGELPIKLTASTKQGSKSSSGQSLFDDVCRQLEARCDFWKPSDWKGLAHEDVIAKWKNRNTNLFLAASLRQVSTLRARQGDKRSADAHSKGASLIARSKVRITSGSQAQQIKGIGPKIAAKIDELLATHKLEILEEEQEVDRVLKLFMEIWGVNVATARVWYDRDLRTYEDIEREVEEGNIALTKLQKYWWKHKEDFPQPMDRAEMKQIGTLIEKAAKLVVPNSETIIVGSYRRNKTSSKDVDVLILVDGKEKEHSSSHLTIQIADQLSTLCDLEVVVSGEAVVMGGVRLPKGGTKETQTGSKLVASKETQIGSKLAAQKNKHLWRRMDFYVQLKEERACALLAHTGPYDYNIRMRLAAKEMGWKLNEYHLYDENGDIISTESEADVQNLLGFDEAEPEERA